MTRFSATAPRTVKPFGDITALQAGAWVLNTQIIRTDLSLAAKWVLFALSQTVHAEDGHGQGISTSSASDLAAMVGLSEPMVVDAIDELQAAQVIEPEVGTELWHGSGYRLLMTEGDR